MTIPADSAASNGQLRARSEAVLRGPDARLMMLQHPLASLLCDHCFRLKVSGWERLLAEASLLVGVPSGQALTMDAGTPVAGWYRRSGERPLDPIDVEHEPERVADVEYVDRIYSEVETAIQARTNRLAARGQFPGFGLGAQRWRP